MYLPSRDVARELAHFESLGATVTFAIEAFGTRVAMAALSHAPPALLLAGHLKGGLPVLVFRTTDLEREIAQLEGRGVATAARFEIPHGPAAELQMAGPQRVALYELTRPDTAKRLAGRRDF